MEALQCEAVLLAAEQGSLTAAAERLDYTQSGITRMISSLEEELGFPLFIRSRRGVRLDRGAGATAAGAAEGAAEGRAIRGGDPRHCERLPHNRLLLQYFRDVDAGDPEEI